MALRFYLVSAVAAILVVFGSCTRNECGNCGAKHPQQKFCELPWVYHVHVHNVEPAPLPGEADLGFYRNPYRAINCTLIKVFKSKTYSRVSPADHDHDHEEINEIHLTTPVMDTEPTTLMPQEESVLIYTPSAFCGAQIELKKDYILGGYYNKTDTQGIEYHKTQACFWVQQWDELTEEMMTWIDEEYGAHCDCKIPEVRTLSYINGNRPSRGPEYPTETSGLWTPFGDCHYNPLTAAHERVEDCETKYSLCRRVSNECRWELTNSYRACFERREFQMTLKKGMGAVTNARDCEKLENRRKRRKCRKLFQTDREETRNREVTVPATSAR